MRKKGNEPSNLQMNLQMNFSLVGRLLMGNGRFHLLVVLLAGQNGAGTVQLL